MREHWLLGPPGTGKTTTLSRMIVDAAKEYGSDGVLVSSFTKAAAVELAGRNLPIDSARVGTLHALCYRALGMPQIAESNIREFNDEHKEHKLFVGSSMSDEGVWEYEPRSENDAYFAAYQQQRARRIPPMRQTFNGGFDPSYMRFVLTWEGWKKAHEYMDFSDLLEHALHDIDGSPIDASVLFVDEAQDCTPLMMSVARKWAKGMDKLVLAFDEEQCQPPGTMVLTTRGEKPIEDLEPSVDRVVSIDRNYGEMRPCGYGFRKETRPYSGPMITVTAKGMCTRSTPNHRWLVRWNARANAEAHVVYLMRQGGKFRVGWCKLFHSGGVMHLGSRARIERADAAWILHVAYDRTEASIMESFIAAKYGLPLVTFMEVAKSQHYTQEALDGLFAMFSDGELRSRANKCLEDFGRDMRYPLWEPDCVSRGGTSIFITRACNLLDGVMMVPIASKRKYFWEEATISSHQYGGDVISLDVDKHPYYVADGIVTHNSLYTWAGADPEQLFATEPDEPPTVLSQSYRVPRAVHAVADRWRKKISWRIEKEYLPRDEDGCVKNRLDLDYTSTGALLNLIEETIGQGKSVMLLASCSYMLRDAIDAMKREGIPYANRYRPSRAEWNPLDPGTARRMTPVQRVKAYLRVSEAAWGRDARLWNTEDLKAWLPHIRLDDIFRHGTKSHVMSKDFSLPSSEDQRAVAIHDMLKEGGREKFLPAGDGDLDWLASRLQGDTGERMRFPLRIAQRHGPRALLDRPLVTVGTIHSVKGAEADVVILFPDLSALGNDEWLAEGTRRDAILRMFYVAMTRSREGLVLAGQATKRHVPLWQN